MNDTENHSPATKNEEANREAEQLLDNIDRSASVAVKGGRETIYCLSVIGQIEGHYVLPEGQKATKYEQLIPLLVSVEENREFDGLLVILNTMGGDVEAGLALAELIASMKKPTVTLVRGGGHSIGVPLAVSAKRCFIVPSATMILHPVRFNGLVMGVPQTMSYFRRIEDRILDYITAHSTARREDLYRLMHNSGELLNDHGSLLTGREAVELGLCQGLGSLRDALSCLHHMIGKGADHHAHESL